MQVKVFESPDMASGLRMVREELGPDALILSTRTVRNGKLGLLGRPVFEITAAIDGALPAAPDGTAETPPSSHRVPPAHRSYLRNTGATPAEAGIRQLGSTELKELLRKKLSTVTLRPNQADPEVRADEGGRPGMLTEIDELKTMVQTLASEVSRLKTPPAEPAASPVEPSPPVAPARPAPPDPLLHLLEGQGISADNAATIAGFARESLSFEELSRPDKLSGFLREAIAGLLQVAPPDFADASGPQRIALVGPTGVGKTTTLAKIAAHFLSNYSRSVALITIDTYRIAAVEQLKVYGEIMRLPVEVVITPAQLAAALERHRDKELILIDTAGRSPRDNVCIEELATFLKPELNIETHLVLSAVTREPELLETVKRFSPLSIDRTIFTKIDECGTLGVLLNTQIHNPSPLSYITNGQRVPEDLLEIDRQSVSRLILPPLEGSAS